MRHLLVTGKTQAVLWESKQMAKIRKIKKDPSPHKNLYVVDACFLANRFIPEDRAPDTVEKRRIRRCNEWWDEIDREFTMRVPAELDRDPDLVLSQAAKRIRDLESQLDEAVI